MTFSGRKTLSSPRIRLTLTGLRANNLLVMHRLKLFVLLIAAISAIASCSDPKSERYSIQNSKAYEASMFRQNCAICHGPEAEGKTLDDGRIIPNVRDGEHKYKTADEIYRHISDGGNGMVPFRDQLTKREIDLLVNFVLKDLRSQNHLR